MAKMSSYFPNAISQSNSFAVLRHWWTPTFYSWFFAQVDRSKKRYQIHARYMRFSDVLFRIKYFPVQLDNQNLLQYWVNDGPKIFSQFLSRSIFMIFGKRGSFEKCIKFMLKIDIFQVYSAKWKFSPCN